MMRAAILALSGALLAGCNGTLAPVVKTEGQEVAVGVATKCIKAEDVPKTPKFPLDLVELKPGEELSRYSHAAREERKVRVEYVKKVEEVLKKCAE